jgi:hypothetical protein
MAVPRPVLLALIGIGLLASVFLVTRSGTGGSVSSSAAPATHVAPERGTKAHARKAAPAKRAHVRKPARAAKAAAPKPVVPGATGGVQARVLAAAKALGEGKVVVFFFTSPGAADDVGARIAVNSLRGTRGVEVFDATLDEVAAYRPMLSTVGISQIPSTVVVRPGKKAVLIQGFVDAGTLRQNVADALR